jgi:glycosyltransferase involved in cell wall biosynthesis
MKFAIDTHHLLLENAGTKRITVNLLDQLRTELKIDFIELKPFYRLAWGKGIAGKIIGHMFRFFWVHIHLPVLCIFKNVRVLLSPEFNTPLYTTCKRVVIVPDAHIRAQGEYINSLWFNWYYLPFIEPAIRKADLILTISVFAKKQIVDLMKLDENKVHAVYLGVDKSFFAEDAAQRQLKDITDQGLKNKEYILFVGTFEARKNIERLLEAFALFKTKHSSRAKQIKLAIVGKPAAGIFSDRSGQIEKLIQQLNLKNEVVMCGYLSDTALPNLYRGASMVAFPSIYEGFGLPIIEGFASGVPVLTSDVCSMPEIAGSAAVVVDPYKINEIAEKIELLMFDLSLRARLIESGYERVKEFTWKNCVSQMFSHIRPLLK